MSAIIVIGNGTNELVAAHRLRRAGHEVTVLRGLNAATPEFDFGWVPPVVLRELDLPPHLVETRRPEPWAKVLPESEGLALTADLAATQKSIARLSERDAARWPEFCARMQTLAGMLEALYLAPPPDPLADTVGGRLALLRTGLSLRRFGRDALHEFLRVLPMPIADLLDEWFEGDLLKGVLAAGAVMHLRQGPRSGGTAFNFLHHHVGSPLGVFRQAQTDFRAVLEAQTGVTIRDGLVRRVQTEKGRTTGILLEDGLALRADAVVSGAFVQPTMLDWIDPGLLDPTLVRAIQRVRSRGPSAQVVLTLDRHPAFEHLVIAPSVDAVERAYEDVKHGSTSESPILEVRYAGTTEAGRHRVHVHVQYVPHTPSDGIWDPAHAEKLGADVLLRLGAEVPGLADTVVERHVFTPDDLKHVGGCPEGQCYGAELTLDQILWMRPVPELAHYRTPIEGLFLCGVDTHPGGGILGLGGLHAARAVRRQLGG